MKPVLAKKVIKSEKDITSLYIIELIKVRQGLSVKTHKDLSEKAKIREDAPPQEKYDEYLRHDLKICEEAFYFFKQDIEGESSLNNREKALAKNFRPEEFSLSLDYWFRLPSTSDQHYNIDHKLREKTHKWLELNKAPPIVER